MGWTMAATEPAPAPARRQLAFPAAPAGLGRLIAFLAGVAMVILGIVVLVHPGVPYLHYTAWGVVAGGAGLIAVAWAP